jgi:hypothetical protein
MRLLAAFVCEVVAVSAIELAACIELGHPSLTGRAQKEMSDAVIDRDRSKRHLLLDGFVIAVAPA